ncbi:phosphoserine aminotransferase [Cohnella xylanilytica]|uniref:3-phosphoserine/phosphohydroxythreonine transaminase n=1 Tax=Cohnella xylanilytica TaxID=557555 RepID=UPI001B1D66FD|nr:3-phosphoserine/phosphohydroxythreonine transaminase [Cohnella xylanilytica]GIO11635.1 phosphoserine aminotransferase [Cohnella xylanilytica]
METRKMNFNPGPAALPLEVLEEARDSLVSHGKLGMSIMEASHRSPAVEELFRETERRLLSLAEAPAGYRVLFMGGGASAQFALVPMNLLPRGGFAAYALTGSFAEKAYEEAARVGRAEIAFSSKESGWRRAPVPEEVRSTPGAAYLHVTVNNTIEGSQWNGLPVTGGAPLVGDVTSCLLGRRLDLSKFSLVYAGAQKNLGPAGVTAVIAKESILADAGEGLPLIFRYATYLKNDSLYNTPPVHSVYMMNLVLRWTERQGGVAALETANAAKAKRLYDAIDRSGGFYEGAVEEAARSMMNVTWRIADRKLENRFLAMAEENGFEGLAGHRSVGGMRASLYNAVSPESCGALAEFMNEFARLHG